MTSAHFQHISDHLAEQGWAFTPNFLPPAITAQLTGDISTMRDAMHAATISQARTANPEIRGDSILWLEEENSTSAQRDLAHIFESLRLHLNAELQLGLFDFECHAAMYPAGAFYRKHLDQFQTNNQRTLSTVLYLNHDWEPEHGGQLRLYLQDDEHMDIQPTGGTLVTFLSNRFWHEVLPATRERLSITGWFKTRSEVLL
jgi:SM-20-related protein